MARYKLTIEYDGSRYYGWQAQKGHRTVQGEFLTAFDRMFPGMKVDFYGAGRTDSGVHALAQVAHLEVREEMPPRKLQFRINDLLPPDIHVLGAEKTPPRFHARHDAVARSYVYLVSKRRTAFNKPYCWWVKDDLDTGRMAEVAGLMAGRHDFRSFTDQLPSEGSTLVEVLFADIHENEDLIALHITGSHFLWKMVRRITGVVVEAGRRKLDAGQVVGFLEKSSPVPAQLTAPPSGLFLHKVFYQGDPLLRGAEVLPRILNFAAFQPNI
ncbi:MAG TPA: tRNA pseudouridine(38-40) synthase TruA [Prolixibacteraceae bacterium]|jgi:tRNA pseudouridine38-40 synthase|nr:tRNA pseudouridine(38-40) synthase TruA [Bacteroidales bacterium]HNQ37939.1 tRNA pseudouridine(38-40) synthase TruA [Prolixibacteraceae bacterium]HOY50567.1 tRNA pseudouridine(38-40) synthase TruA [Prolixibacteraceae bacterium]